MLAALRHVQKVACWCFLRSRVGCVHKSLKSSNIIWISKVDDINRDIILLETHSNVFEIFFCALSQRMPNEHHNSLPLGLVLSMLQGKLCNLHGSQNISSSINVNIVNGIDQVTNLIGLRQSQLNSINQFLYEKKTKYVYLPFASHAKYADCALWVLLRLGLSDNGSCVDLAVPSGRSEISVSAPF